jgi:hypothetical protein
MMNGTAAEEKEGSNEKSGDKHRRQWKISPNIN